MDLVSVDLWSTWQHLEGSFESVFLGICLPVRLSASMGITHDLPEVHIQRLSFWSIGLAIWGFSMWDFRLRQSGSER
jgi:hypothetical protein